MQYLFGTTYIRILEVSENQRGSSRLDITEKSSLEGGEVPKTRNTFGEFLKTKREARSWERLEKGLKAQDQRDADTALQTTQISWPGTIKEDNEGISPIDIKKNDILRSLDRSQSEILSKVYLKLLAFYERKCRELGRPQEDATRLAANFLRENSTYFRGEIINGTDPLIIQRELRARGKAYMEEVAQGKYDTKSIGYSLTSLPNNIENMVVLSSSHLAETPLETPSPGLEFTPNGTGATGPNIISPTGEGDGLTQEETNSLNSSKNINTEGFEEVFDSVEVQASLIAYEEATLSARQFRETYIEPQEQEINESDEIPKDSELPHPSNLVSGQYTRPIEIDEGKIEGWENMRSGDTFPLISDMDDSTFLAKREGNYIIIRDPPIKWKIEKPEDMSFMLDLLKHPFGREVLSLGKSYVDELVKIIKLKPGFENLRGRQIADVIFVLVYNMLPMGNNDKIERVTLLGKTGDSIDKTMGKIFDNQNLSAQFMNEMGNMGIFDTGSGNLRGFTFLEFIRSQNLKD